MSDPGSDSENAARAGVPDIPGDTPPASSPAPAPEPQEREPGRDEEAKKDEAAERGGSSTEGT